MANSEQESSSPLGTLRTSVGYIGDPKADQSTTLRVVEPPPDTRQYLRGSLYAVVELAGDSPAREQIADRLLSAIQRTYYSARGSQSQVIRQAVQQADQLVAEYNAQAGAAALHADIICAALLRNRLVVLSSGQAIALIMTGERVHIFPADVVSAPLDAGTGARAEPELFREEVRPGDAIFLGGGGWLDLVPIRTLASTVAYVTVENCEAAAQGLYEMTADAATPGLLIVLDAGESAGGGAAPSTGSPPPPAPRPRRTLWRGLPTALGARLAAGQAGPPAAAVAAAAATTAPPASSGAGGAIGDGPLNAAGAGAASQAATPEHPDELLSAAGQPATGSDTGQPSVKASAGIGAAAAMAWARSKGFFRTMLPDHRSQEASSPASTAAVASQATGSQSAQPRAAAAVSVGEAEAGDEETEPPPAPPLAPSAVPFTPPPPTSGGRARLFIAIAIVIAVLIPAVVSALPRGQVSAPTVDVEQYLSAARAQYLSAMDALEAGNEDNARAQLAKADETLFQAQQAVGPDPAIEELNTQVRAALDQVEHVEPLYALVEPLVTFPADAAPQRILVVDQDIYVLDTVRQMVQRFRLDTTGTMVPDNEGEIVLQEGDVVDGITVGRLAAMAWQPIVPGVEDKANLLVLDRNNNVFRYNDRVDGVRAVEFGAQAEWQSPSLLQSYAGRVYIADEGAGQIHRYDAGAYQEQPVPWFGEGNEASLVGTVSMGIDGDIWLMVNTGMVLRFREGAQIPFSLEQRLGLASEPVDMAVGGDVTNLIYLADAAEERIVVYDKNGNYLRQFVAAEGNPLAGLSGIYVDEVGGSLYLLTKSALYKHPLPR